MDYVRDKTRQFLGVILSALVLGLAACQGSGASSDTGGGAGGSGPQPIPGPSIMRQGVVVLDPQSDQEAPIRLHEKTGTVTVSASENDYSGSFSATVTESSCILVAPTSDAPPIKTFHVQALDTPCVIASIVVTDRSGHRATDYFSVH